MSTCECEWIFNHRCCYFFVRCCSSSEGFFLFSSWKDADSDRTLKLTPICTTVGIRGTTFVLLWLTTGVIGSSGSYNSSGNDKWFQHWIFYHNFWIEFFSGRFLGYNIARKKKKKIFFEIFILLCTPATSHSTTAALHSLLYHRKTQKLADWIFVNIFFRFFNFGATIYFGNIVGDHTNIDVKKPVFGHIYFTPKLGKL